MRQVILLLVALSAIAPSISPAVFSQETAASPRRAAIVISEVLYHAPGDEDALEFIELANAGDAAVDLSGWSLAGGVEFTFPAGARSEAGSYLVVCRDVEVFRKAYGEVESLAGTFTGALANGGERIVLADASGAEIDRLEYRDGDPWPVSADGEGASLERVSLATRGGRARHWAPSVPLAEPGKPAGTPGRANSVAAPSPPPSITALRVWPGFPRPDEAVHVQARVESDAAIASARVAYRVFASGAPVQEDAVAFEPVAGDAPGLRRATIPGQAAGTIIRWRIECEDEAGGKRQLPWPGDLRPWLSVITQPRTAPDASVPVALIFTLPSEDAAPRRAVRGARRYGTAAPESSARGSSAFLYEEPGGERQFFDFLQVSPRSGGVKVRFHKDRPLELEDPLARIGGEVRTANLVFEGVPRFILAEHLAYELYRRCGVPSPLAAPVRVAIDGRVAGYHLLIEQPNRSFLRRIGRDDSGNLYKILWYGRGVVGQHEKKTNPAQGHEDLVELVRALAVRDPEEQWREIERRFAVDETIGYFAASLCLSNWDGFFNNYFTYHDAGGTEKWEIYPWDEDKTWGHYDGLPYDEVFHDMPLDYGATGARSAESERVNPLRRLFGGGGGFGAWQRPPGHFSGPLLANPRYRARYLERLRDIVRDIYTEEAFLPLIDLLEERLLPEVELRAGISGESPRAAVARFSGEVQALRRHLELRREFILAAAEIRALEGR